MTPEHLRIIDAAVGLALDAAPQKRDGILAAAAEGDSHLLEAMRVLLREVESRKFTALPSTLPKPINVGREVGGYTIRRELGEGGMGVVYLADTREPVYRQVALKLVRSGWSQESVLARFQQERAALALMDHPNVAKIFDAGSTEDGRPYFVMEYVRGEPITQFADREKLDITQRLEVFCQVCEAVQHAHNKGVIHRDIKPSNVLVSVVGKQRVAKVIDFGIAKAAAPAMQSGPAMTEQGQLMGTVEYMSPEQAAGAVDVDTRTDVYGLGILLYELISGTLPFETLELQGAGVGGAAKVIRETEPPRPSTRLRAIGSAADGIAASRQSDAHALEETLRRELEWIPLLAIRKDRTARYASPAHLADDVRRYLHGEPLLAGPTSTAYRVRKFAERHRRGILAAGLVLAVGLLGVIGTTAGVLRASAEAAARKLADQEVGRRRVEAGVTAEVLEALLTNDAEMLGVDRDATIDQLLWKATEILELRRHEMSPVVYATMRHVIAKELVAAGALDGGEQQLLDVIDYIRTEVSSESSLLAEALFDLGRLHWDAGRDAEAKECYQEAMRLAEEMDPEGVDLAFYRVFYAGIVIAEAEAAEGAQRESLTRDAAQLLDEAARVERLGTADALRAHNMARCYQADMLVHLQDEPERGLEELRKVAEAQFAARGRAAFDAFRKTLQLLYVNLLEFERLDDAGRVVEFWAENADRLLGPGNIETLNARLAKVYLEHQLGRTESAIELVGAARKEIEEVHGIRSRTLGKALRIQIGPCYRFLGADTLADSAFEAADRILGVDGR
jgi:non-specific serine/threonine protein kinase/serine/threonine-protein kinase